MENKLLEMDQYLMALSAELKLETGLKEEICREIEQSLYDKFNELLIKGYSLEAAVSRTLESFESPAALAGMFNAIHNKDRLDLDKAFKLLYDRKALLVAILATLLMSILV